jgi:hypothetical protein
MNLDFIVYAVAVLLLSSVVLFVKTALFDRQPQKLGLLLVILACPLYLVYFNDRWPKTFGTLPMRDAVRPLDNLRGTGRLFRHADSNFHSNLVPALILAVILLTHLTVFQRVAIRERLQKVWNPIANFFAGSVVATLVGGTVVSTFSWGWQGAIIVTVALTLVYLGILAVLGAIIELTVVLTKLFLVWLNRKVFAVATLITRVSSWVSSLSGRLVSRALIERIQKETDEQESIFVLEQDAQDRALYEAFLRDRARKRRAAARRGRVLPPEEFATYDSIPTAAEPGGQVPPPEQMAAPGSMAQMDGSG